MFFYFGIGVEKCAKRLQVSLLKRFLEHRYYHFMTVGLPLGDKYGKMNTNRVNLSLSRLRQLKYNLKLSLTLKFSFLHCGH